MRNTTSLGVSVRREGKLKITFLLTVGLFVVSPSSSLSQSKDKSNSFSVTEDSLKIEQVNKTDPQAKYPNTWGRYILKKYGILNPGNLPLHFEKMILPLQEILLFIKDQDITKEEFVRYKFYRRIYTGFGIDSLARVPLGIVLREVDSATAEKEAEKLRAFDVEILRFEETPEKRWVANSRVPLFSIEKIALDSTVDKIKEFPINEPALNKAELKKLVENEILETIAISPRKDKIALVEKNDRFIERSDETEAYEETKYSLWLLEVDTRQIRCLVRPQDVNNDGVNIPSFSPNGEWIAFGSFDKDGHSPMTTSHTWIVDTAGYTIECVKISSPFDHSSNWPNKWIGDDKLVVRGIRMQYVDHSWKDIESDFIYDCRTKKIEPTK